MDRKRLGSAEQAAPLKEGRNSSDVIDMPMSQEQGIKV
jgi:hypothetical protein